jgi:hypothetical protein
MIDYTQFFPFLKIYNDVFFINFKMNKITETREPTTPFGKCFSIMLTLYDTKALLWQIQYN